MPLVKTNSIHLKTPLGTSEVQLLVGDITDLKQDEAVDIVVVSTFQGDYSVASHETLVSALYQKLQIDVKELARDKEVDMRSHFHCWVSKPLPKNIPFRRLVCFERARRVDSGTTAQQISTLFRAMTPIFNNEDTTVITPLLATGNQGQSRTAVLRATVDGACHWIKAGLPLRCLKLVLFARDPEHLPKRDHEALDLFLKLKQYWEATNLKQNEEDQKNDVFISHSGRDDHWAEVIHKELRLINSSLRVLKKQVEFSTDQVWQEELFHIMMQSKQIIIVLTPSYVQSPECLEQFNMALCVNRLSSLHQICPMYVETVASFPSYMQLVQYVECRERKAGEKSKEFINAACLNLLSTPSYTSQTNVSEVQDVADQYYDVFISYAHRNPDSAETLLKYFQEAYPELKVFFDRSELTTGSLWQQRLYNAVDKTRCMVALLSPAYIRSAVCQEEYNIALNRALAQKPVHLTPVCVEEIEDLPKTFSYVPILDGFSKDQNAVLKHISEDIINLLHQDPQDAKIPSGTLSFYKPNFYVQASHVQEATRKTEFDHYFKKQDNSIIYKSMPKSEPHQTEKSNSASTDCEVVFSFSHDSIRLAFILTELIARISPDTNCKFISENNKERLHLLDQAKLVVIFVSDGYIESSQLLEELHLSLCRQRVEKPSQIIYLIQAMHLNQEPFYLHMLDYRVGLTDKLWTSLSAEESRHGKTKFEKIGAGASQTFTITRNGMRGSYSCSPQERLALSKAALEISDIVNGRPTHVTVGPNIVNIGDLHETSSDKTIPLQQCLRPYSKDEPVTNQISTDKPQKEMAENKPREITVERDQSAEIVAAQREADEKTTEQEEQRKTDYSAASTRVDSDNQDNVSDVIGNHEDCDYFVVKANKLQKKSAFCLIL